MVCTFHLHPYNCFYTEQWLTIMENNKSQLAWCPHLNHYKTTLGCAASLPFVKTLATRECWTEIRAMCPVEPHASGAKTPGYSDNSKPGQTGRVSTLEHLQGCRVHLLVGGTNRGIVLGGEAATLGAS